MNEVDLMSGFKDLDNNMVIQEEPMPIQTNTLKKQMMDEIRRNYT